MTAEAQVDQQANDPPTELASRSPIRIVLTPSQAAEFHRLRTKKGMSRTQLLEAALVLYFKFHHDKPWPLNVKRRDI